MIFDTLFDYITLVLIFSGLAWLYVLDILEPQNKAIHLVVSFFLFLALSAGREYLL